MLKVGSVRRLAMGRYSLCVCGGAKLVSVCSVMECVCGAGARASVGCPSAPV